MGREIEQIRECKICHKMLDLENFRISYRDYGDVRKFYPQRTCKFCTSKKSAQKQNDLYNSDPNYKTKKKAKALNYQKNNRDKINEYRRKWQKQYEKDHPEWRLHRRLSTAIRQHIKSPKCFRSILKYLPYTMQELKEHLENQFDEFMSWENYGIYWSIDHIIPQSLLPYHTMDDENFKICWALSNLRPLNHVENMKKGNKIQ